MLGTAGNRNSWYAPGYMWRKWYRLGNSKNGSTAWSLKADVTVSSFENTRHATV